MFVLSLLLPPGRVWRISVRSCADGSITTGSKSACCRSAGELPQDARRHATGTTLVGASRKRRGAGRGAPGGTRRRRRARHGEEPRAADGEERARAAGTAAGACAAGRAAWPRRPAGTRERPRATRPAQARPSVARCGGDSFWTCPARTRLVPPIRPAYVRPPRVGLSLKK